MNNKIRSFISVDIEDTSIQNKIINLKNTLTQDISQIKFVEGKNLHLTLKFLGDIYETDIQNIIRKLNEIKIDKFKFKLTGVGCFDPKFPRVIWVGVEQGKEELIRLQNEIEKRLIELGFKPEKRKYSPHLTVGRVKTVKNKRELLSQLDQLKNNDFGEIFVNNFRLRKSTLTPKGPNYEIIKEFILEGN
jgi:2'-5' RNA ligase